MDEPVNKKSFISIFKEVVMAVNEAHTFHTFPEDIKTCERTQNQDC